MSKETIKCNDGNIKQIVKEQIELLGNEADLNHLDVSEVTNMSGMFVGSRFNGDISKWNVSNVTDMSQMFAVSKFNGDISNWDVSDVKIMRSMFSRSQFNEDISGWDVSNVTDMYGMFDNSQFNGDISKWDVSNVTDMGSMFSDSQFNGDISKWDVSNVTNIKIMFYKSQFNGDISKWDVSNVKKMNGMFYKSQFNGDISKWDVSNVTDTRGIFEDCPISEENKPKITFNYKDVLNEYELNRIKSDYSIEEIMVFEKNAEKLTADLNAGVVMYEWEYIDTHFSKGFCPLSYLFLEENNMILSSENDENLGFLERKDIPDWIVLRFLRKLSSASDSDRNKSYVFSISHLIKNAKYTDKSIAANIGSILMLASDLWSDRTSWEDAWEVVKEFSDLCVLDDDAQASIEQWVETYQ